MKIKWIDTRKSIPGIGIMNTNDTQNVPDELGRALIKQGQAEEITPKKKKG